MSNATRSVFEEIYLRKRSLKTGILNFSKKLSWLDIFIFVCALGDFFVTLRSFYKKSPRNEN